MKKILLASAALAVAVSCDNASSRVASIEGETQNSPDGKLELVFSVEDGTPMYSLSYDGRTVVAPSRLGFELFGENPDLVSGFTMGTVDRDSHDEYWTPVWGEESRIRNQYNEMLVTLSQKETGRNMNIRFRVFDDGIGFRYEFPLENSLAYFSIKEELTEFAMTGDHTAWWISGDYDTQEYNYTESRLSEIGG
ncbi:MAG: glycoside hydrolase family 97 N-terminal domain-containing protein, partial [Bacteroidales bacterium]|nr:glycoside hydrolase family 97 N-terminal domain-containing protein [Bacteroidales bacterium]